MPPFEGMSPQEAPKQLKPETIDPDKPESAYQNPEIAAQAMRIQKAAAEGKLEDEIMTHALQEAIKAGDFAMINRITSGTIGKSGEAGEGGHNPIELVPIELQIESSAGQTEEATPLDRLSGSLSGDNGENPSALVDLSTLLEGDELPKPKDPKQTGISRLKGIFGG
jgi:hypothetical protein